MPEAICWCHFVVAMAMVVIRGMCVLCIMAIRRLLQTAATLCGQLVLIDGYVGLLPEAMCCWWCNILPWRWGTSVHKMSWLYTTLSRLIPLPKAICVAMATCNLVGERV